MNPVLHDRIGGSRSIQCQISVFRIRSVLEKSRTDCSLSFLIQASAFLYETLSFEVASAEAALPPCVKT